MRFSSLNNVVMALLLPGLIVIQFGCSKKNPQQETLKEYRKMIEKQKAASVREEEEALKKIPEMTAEGYEKLGDSYVKQGNLDMAFIQYGRAVTLDRKGMSVRYKIGRLFLEKGLTQEAKK